MRSISLTAKISLFIATLLLSALACRTRNETQTSKGKDSETTSEACDKATVIWNNLRTTPYTSLPALTAPGASTLLTFSKSAFTAKSFSNGGDTIEPGRKKLVHTFGAVARLSLERIPDMPESPFSGIYKTGAKCLIGRFSVATKPTDDNMIPALAIKFLLEGQQDSVNLHIMNSVDGQSGPDAHNFFRETFTNILQPPKGTAAKALALLFKRGAQAFGAKDPSANTLSVEHLAKINIDGSRVDAVNAPYKLEFVPTEAAKEFMRGKTVADDFRVSLTSIPSGTALYHVFGAFGNDTGISEMQPLGTLVLTSEIVISKYGDENLWFQHNKEMTSP